MARWNEYYLLVFVRLDGGESTYRLGSISRPRYEFHEAAMTTNEAILHVPAWKAFYTERVKKIIQDLDGVAEVMES